MNYFLLYLLTILDSALVCITFIFIITMIIEIIKFMLYMMDESNNEMYILLKQKSVLNRVILVISLIIVIIVPDKEGIILITAGGKTMDYIQQDSTLQKLPEQSTRLLYEYMNKQIKQLEK